MAVDFTCVTEIPGNRATKEQLLRLYHRYHVAGRYVVDKRVLEVACGAGFGLGYLAQKATRVVGGDYTESLLRVACSHYNGRVPLVCFDAHRLPFQNQIFDVVIIYEAIYYLQKPEEFIAESRRVLANRGTLLIGTVNRDWDEFTPSLLSTRYLSVPELADLLVSNGFENLEFFGAFPTEAASTREKVVSLIRKVAVGLNLVPKTLGAREKLKRLFYGNLAPLPHEVDDDRTDLCTLVPITGERSDSKHKIIYAAATIYK